MWRSEVLALLVTAALSGTAFAQAASPPCAPGFGIGLADVRTGTKDPRARTYVVDHVAPGATFTRRLQLCNGSDAPLEVQLYAGAAQVEDGTFSVVEGRVPNELARWTTLAPSRVTLRPRERATTTASFAVPKDAESGERYAVLLAELPPRTGGSGIPVASRVGVRVYLDVGPGGAPKSDFTVDSLQAARDGEGRARITARVHNTGRRALDLRGSLSLQDGPGGQSGGPYPATLGSTIGPGDTQPVLVKLDRSIIDGPWTAELSLTSGLLERRVKAGLNFPAGAGQSGPPVDVEQLPVPSDEVFSPVRLLPLFGIPLVAAGVLLWRRRSNAVSSRK